MPEATAVRRVLVVYGTRPEGIKLAPLVAALDRAPGIAPVVAVTGQHREMLDQVNDLFGIVPTFDLDIITPRQTLTDITTRALTGLSTVLRDGCYDAVLVQGDTTTSLAGALAAFYERVPVVHLEAGLRSGRKLSPYPEEMNRRLTGQLTDLHLAPTDQARDALVAERIAPASIAVTGNTVIDALYWTVRLNVPYGDQRIPRLIRRSTGSVLVTAHRRESWGAPMAGVARAVARLASDHPDVAFVIPAHLNPRVREVLLPPLRDLENVLLAEPLPYGEFCHLMNDCDVLLTDSGGVQEEGPSLGKPVLVLRDCTERVEGVTAGTATLVGTDEERIVTETDRLLRERAGPRRSTWRPSPYGDGRAAERSLAAIRAMLGMGERLADFSPPPPVSMPRPRLLSASRHVG